MHALVLVDIQNDFCAGGALEVKDGDAVVAAANVEIPKFPIVVATQDWHPQKHGSFAVNHAEKQPGDLIDLSGLPQILWPTHCVQHTWGAGLHPLLHSAKIDRIFPKGTHIDIDSYSGFFDNARRFQTGLELYFRNRGVTQLAIMGLATDYCVRFTALDAVDLGFDTFLLTAGCRGVNLKPNDAEDAINYMAKQGVKIVSRW